MLLKFIESHEPAWLRKIEIPNWLTALLLAVFVLRIPSLFEPYYYGDEMIYLSLGNGIRNGLTLYRDIHDNKPPLLYFVASIATNVFWFRAILTVWVLFTVIAFYKLSDRLFPKKKLMALTATVSFAILTTLPTFEGQIANAENFMMGTTILAFYVLLSKSISLKKIFLAGVLLSISSLFKIPSIFDVGVIVFYWIFLIKKLDLKNINEFIKNSIVLLAGVVSPILITFVWYYFKGALNEYWIAAFLQNFGYVSTWRPESVAQPFLQKNLPLLIRAGIVMLSSGVLFIFRSKLTKPFIFACLWLLFSLFAATLSERPYPHYILQVVPSISLLISILLLSVKIDQTLTLIPLLLLGLAVLRFNFWHYPTITYYQNFLRYTLKQQTKEQYFNFFSKTTTTVYEISEYVQSTTNKEDRIFVWGDSPAVYALSDRTSPIKYVATYHIHDFSSKENVLDEVVSEKPKLIIIMPESEQFEELNQYLVLNYIPVHNVNGASIWRRVENISLLR